MTDQQEASAMPSGPVTVGDPPSPVGLYSFLKMQINIEGDDTDLFTPDKGGLRSDSSLYPIVWHEFAHYLQNVTTTIGVRLFLNWLTRLVDFSSEESRKGVLHAPLYRDPHSFFSAEYASLLEQTNELMGTGKPLDPAPPTTCSPFELYLKGRDRRYAWLCLEDEKGRVGVPMLGDAFIEGMAQSVQWLAQNHGVWSDDALRNRGIHDQDVYYHALARYCRHHFPNANPAIATTILSNLCLLTSQPGVFFWKLHRERRALSTTDQWLNYRAEAFLLAEVQDGISGALAELQRFEDNNRDKTSAFMSMAMDVVGTMREALGAQRTDGERMMMLDVSPENLEHLAQRFGFPPLYSLSIDSGWSVRSATRLHKFCFLSRGLYEVVDTLYRNSMSAECSFLHKRYCTGQKGPHCRINRLQIPLDSAGELCVVGAAADLLGVRGKRIAAI